MSAPDKGQLPRFFALTFAVTWTFWFAADALSANGGSAAPGLAVLRIPLFYLGTFAPSLVALCLAARADGRAGAGGWRRLDFCTELCGAGGDDAGDAGIER